MNLLKPMFNLSLLPMTVAVAGVLALIKIREGEIARLPKHVQLRVRRADKRSHARLRRRKRPILRHARIKIGQRRVL